MSKTVTFYFDLSSPYSYFAATQVDALANRTRATILWRPVVLGAIFKQTNNVMNTAVPAKAQYMLVDLNRWAQYYDVPFNFNPYFPQNTMTLHRAIIAAQSLIDEQTGKKLAKAAFEAMWVHQHDITNDTTIVDLIDEVGLDGATILQATSDPTVKGTLRQYTEDALEHGVFGAPSFVVDDHLYWGNDRLPFLEAYLLQE